MENTSNFCEELSNNKPRLDDNHKKKSFVKICRAVRDVNQTNQVVLSFKEHQDFNNKVGPELIKLVEMEIGW